MTNRVESALVAFRCRGQPHRYLHDTVRAFRSQRGNAAIQVALLWDEARPLPEEWTSFLSLSDHVLFHSVAQGIGPTNRLAIAQARILDVEALVIMDGDGLYIEPVEAVNAAIDALDKFDVVVSQQTVVSLPLCDRPGEDRAVYEHFERWLLERRYECRLPHQLQPGLYVLDRRAIATIELTCHHFAADWEIAFRALESGLSIGPTPKKARTATQQTTSFHEEDQRRKFAELFGVLELSRGDVTALVDTFSGENELRYSQQQLDRLSTLCGAAFERPSFGPLIRRSAG